LQPTPYNIVIDAVTLNNLRYSVADHFISVCINPFAYFDGCGSSVH